MTLPIITVPDERLRQVSKPVENFDKKFFQFTRDLTETLLKKVNPAGVGLSAVQVGKLSRIFVLNMPPAYDLESFDDDSPESQVHLFINPEIVDKSKTLTYGSDRKHPIPEGCLSIPALYGPILRHKWVTVKYLTFISETTTELVEKIETFSNFYARVVQHEYDHLDGILFTDYTLKQQETIYFDQGNRLVEVPQPQKLIQW